MNEDKKIQAVPPNDPFMMMWKSLDQHEDDLKLIEQTTRCVPCDHDFSQPKSMAAHCVSQRHLRYLMAQYNHGPSLDLYMEKLKKDLSEYGAYEISEITFVGDETKITCECNPDQPYIYKTRDQVRKHCANNRQHKLYVRSKNPPKPTPKPKPKTKSKKREREEETSSSQSDIEKEAEKALLQDPVFLKEMEIKKLIANPNFRSKTMQNHIELELNNKKE